MKKSIILCFVLGLASFAACNDSYLDKTPETSITEEGFFRSPEDLKLYSDQFYQQFNFKYWGMWSPYYAIMDYPSDNAFHTGISDAISDGSVCSLLDKLTGTLSPSTVSQWDWSDIRAVNYYLARTGKAEGDEAEINHYVGLGRLIRAIRYYYTKVLVYGDVPWYEADLATNDEGLYKTQDTRDYVVKKIFEDLDFAIANMKSGGKGGQSRLYREAALGFAARMAISEGAWRKYHSELGQNDADNYYRRAVEYASQLRESKQFSLNASYDKFFTLMKLKGESEAIFYKDYDYALGVKFNGRSLCDFSTYNLSRDLMEDYLYIKDGKAVPFNTVEGYDKALYSEFYKNRDPRLSSTFWLPGMKRLGVDTPYAPSFDVGGYPQYKYYPRTLDQNSYGGSYSDIAIIRYAEILLIEAEAKAELGTLTQDDLDKTVNLLRQRAGVPAASLSEWTSDIDTAQEAKYPNVSGAMKGAILEIRRERRVELACEGFRCNDLNRWACGERFAIQDEGIYIPEGGQVDLTGDGKFDSTFTVSDESTVALTNGNSGHIVSKTVKAANMTFHSPKDYYSPLSATEMALSPALVQNQYWK